MLMFLTLSFVAFPDQSDALLNKSKARPNIEASGSIGLYYLDQCHQTHPNQTLIEDRKQDWCSNIAEGNDKPWIQYSFPNKAMKLHSYAIRNGCCYFDCCCLNGEIIPMKYGCCCQLYSFSLIGSNDNQTWKILHKVEKGDDYIHWCQFKTYPIELKESFKFIRFVADEERPGCPRCLQINQIELYGQLFDSYESFEDEDTDESISIIGKVKQT